MLNESTRIIKDLANDPTIVKGAAAATAGIGFGTIFGYLERGVGFIAALMGIAVTVALWRKLRLERREAELRIQVLENQLNDKNDSDNR